MNQFLKVLLCSFVLINCTVSGNKETEEGEITSKEVWAKKVSSNVNVVKRETTVRPITIELDSMDLSVYPSERKKIENKRLELAQEFEEITQSQGSDFMDSVGSVFQDLLIDRLIPYWMGTEWDFNGHTNKPNEGLIACGYFVSTTLKHMGLILNRYTFAQQASYYEAKTLLFGEDPLEIRPNNTSDLKTKLRDLANGLYLVGLDNHVGYLWLTDTDQYFIHSDYVSDEVKSEKIEDSPAFRSNLYCVAPISGNQKLMEHWLGGKKVNTITP